MTTDTDLLMALADCGSPDRLLRVILAHRTDWKPPVPLEEFAASVGIEEIKPLTTDGFEGALITDEAKSRGVILFNAASAAQRRRFTIGHELGHFLVPSHRGHQQCTSKDMKQMRQSGERERREAEANAFSAGLLMPKPWFEREMGQLGDADVTHVRTLARMFDTSLEATANRYVDLTDDCCAFVFSKDGVIRYTRGTDDFPRMAVRAKDPLPAGCASAAPRVPGDGVSGWAEVVGETWLQEGKRRLPQILEQSIAQANGYRLTLLFIDAEEVAEEEADDEEDDSWRPRFRR